MNNGAASEKALTDALTEKFRCRVENGGEGRFRLAEAERNIRRQFGEEAFDRLPRTNPAAAMALGDCCTTCTRPRRRTSLTSTTWTTTSRAGLWSWT